MKHNPGLLGAPTDREARSIAKAALNDVAGLLFDEVGVGGLITSSIYEKLDKLEAFDDEGDERFKGHPEGRHPADGSWDKCEPCQWLHRLFGHVSADAERRFVSDPTVIRLLSEHVRAAIDDANKTLARAR